MAALSFLRRCFLHRRIPAVLLSFVIPSKAGFSAKRKILRGRGTCFSPTPALPVFAELDFDSTARYSTLRIIEVSIMTRPLSPKYLSVIFLSALIALLSAQTTAAQNSTASPSPSPLARHYTEGEKLAYYMKGDNDGWTYEVQASGVVKKDANGHFVEAYGWSDFKSNTPMSLSPASLSFRQTLSLDPRFSPPFPISARSSLFSSDRSLTCSPSTATSGSRFVRAI